MKPFVIWLEKEQIDELISVLVSNRNNSSNIVNKELFDVDDLTQLAEQLLEQNNKLVDILKDVKPLTEHEKSRVEAVGVRQKCNNYKQLMKDFQTHCSVHSNGNFQEGGVPPCTDCPMST